MAEHHSQRVHTEGVVLDIGDGMGGLVLYTREDLHGREIEICPVAEPERKTHTEVDERIVNGRTLYTGVFPPLSIGDYNVCRPRERAGQTIRVVSGRVTEIDWR